MEYYAELRETVEKLEALLEGEQSQKGTHEGLPAPTQKSRL